MAIDFSKNLNFPQNLPISSAGNAELVVDRLKRKINLAFLNSDLKAKGRLGGGGLVHHIGF